MKTQYFTATSIDGYIADEDHSLDWLFQFQQMDSMQEETRQFMEQIGAAAMGASTYQWLIEHEDLLAYPEKWPYDFPVWVFSNRSLPTVNGVDLTFARGDIIPPHAQMVKAAKGKNIWLIGGGELVGQFHDKGLLDEIILSVAPVMLGSGAPLLPRDITAPPLELMEAKTHGDTYVTLRYAVQNMV
ncbi:MAG: dihydrofolate reductase family protein [Bacteroidota bacterium]